MLMGDVAIEKLPDFNGDYGSQSGKGHVATLNSTRPSKKKGNGVRAVVRKVCSPEIFSGGKLVLEFLVLK